VTSSKVPSEILDYWNREIVKVLNDPATIAELAKHGLDPAPSTREELARYIQKESDTWARVVREPKITAE
jgi:tripartite-type tricarboxylate transporter receptor subunit TctC